ncbi:MAG: hypothetical protein WDO24_11425 [Pseudomonadota bacterium]
MALALRFRGALIGAATLTVLWPAAGALAQVQQPIQVQSVQVQSAQARTAQAQTAQPMPQPTPPIKIVDELKLGVMAHDIALGGHHRETGEDVNAEILFASPSIFRYILSPRPHFGADINGSGNTSNYYAGLTWGGVFYRPAGAAATASSAISAKALGERRQDLDPRPEAQVARLAYIVQGRRRSRLPAERRGQRRGVHRPYLERRPGQPQRRHHQRRPAVRLQVLGGF